MFEEGTQEVCLQLITRVCLMVIFRSWERKIFLPRYTQGHQRLSQPPWGLSRGRHQGCSPAWPRGRWGEPRGNTRTEVGFNFLYLTYHLLLLFQKGILLTTQPAQLQWCVSLPSSSPQMVTPSPTPTSSQIIHGCICQSTRSWSSPTCWALSPWPY